MARLPVADGFEPRFLAYLHAAIYSSRLQFPAIKQTTGIQNLDSGEYLSLGVAYPPLVEQRAIARFLDIKTAKIDELLAKKRQLIDKLKERRSALIACSVTQGLPREAAKAAGVQPTLGLKRSGIDWAPSIPTCWDAIAIKYVATIESGHTPSRTVAEYWVDCTIRWVSLNDSGYLRNHDLISETYYQISELGMANSSAHLLPEGAVVLSRDATVGLCAITTRPMAVSQHFVAYICGPRLVPSFLLFALKAMNQHLERLSLGTTIATIGMADIKSLEIPLPPVPVQNAIVEYVSQEAGKLDRLVAKVETAILRLTEYRQALIASAVTGKIDVRALA